MLYQQLAFDVAGDARQDQKHGQEQEFVISPERQARLEELKRRVGSWRATSPQRSRRSRTTAAPQRNRRNSPATGRAADAGASCPCEVP